MSQNIIELNDSGDIELALKRVGELLEAEGEEYAIVILGGAALNLSGVLSRSTSDVDVLAFATRHGDETRPTIHRPPEPLPAPLVRAVRAVARDLGLPDEWLNTESALQWTTGLPPGLEQRVEWTRYHALRVGVVGRADLITFKLFAAVDQGRRSVHYRDLTALRPTVEQLEQAESWVREQDASPDFPTLLAEIIAHVRQENR